MFAHPCPINFKNFDDSAENNGDIAENDSNSLQYTNFINLVISECSSNQ